VLPIWIGGIASYEYKQFPSLSKFFAFARTWEELNVLTKIASQFDANYYNI
jgi:hypothetical protein